jgi:archaetidylinositol phosphate synthase
MGEQMSRLVPEDVLLNQTYAHQIARFLVRPLLGTAVRPNHLTVLRLAIGLAACALLALGTRRAEIWSGALWVVTCLLDRADGELARLADLRSESGKILDFHSDLLLDSLWFLSAGISLRHGALGHLGIALGALSSLSVFICIGGAELFERRSGPGVKAYYGLQQFHPDDALFLLALFTWFGWLAPLLIASTLCTPVIGLVIAYRYVRLRAARRFN